MKERTTGLLNWLLLLSLLSQKTTAQDDQPQDQSGEILAALPPGLQLLQIVNVATWTINDKEGGNRFFYIYALKTPQGILYAGVYEQFGPDKKLVNKYRQFSTDFRQIGTWLGLQEDNIAKLSTVDPFDDGTAVSTPPPVSTPPKITTTTVTTPPTSTVPSTVVNTQTTSPSTGNVIIQNPPQPIITTNEPSKPIIPPPVTVSQPPQTVTSTTVTQPPQTTIIPPNTATSTTTVSTNGQSTNIFQSPGSPTNTVVTTPPATTIVTGTQTTATNVTTAPTIVQTPTGTVLVDTRSPELPAQTGSVQVTVQNQPSGTVIVPTTPQPPTNTTIPPPMTTTTPVILPTTTTTSNTMTLPTIPQPTTTTTTTTTNVATPTAVPAQQPPATVVTVRQPTLITPQTAPIITVENLRTIFTNQPAIYGSAYINPNIGNWPMPRPLAAFSRRRTDVDSVVLAQGNRSPIVIYPGIAATRTPSAASVIQPAIEAQKGLRAENVDHFHKSFRHSQRRRYIDD